MSDDKKLTIRVSTVGDPSGAKQVSAALEDNAKATHKLESANQEQIASDDKVIAKKTELRRGLREVGRELPLVGEIGRLAMEPLIGAFVMISAVVSSCLDSIKALGDRSTPEFARLTDAIEAQRTAMEEVDLASLAYDRSLARLASTSATVTAASQLHLSSLKSQNDSEGKLNDASQKRQEAVLEQAEKMGLITHDQYLARKLASDEAYTRKRAELENKMAVTELAEKQRERANLYIESEAIEKSLAKKRTDARAAAGKSAFAAGETDKDKHDLGVTDDKISELEKEAAEIHLKRTGLGRFATLTFQKIWEERAEQNDSEMAAQVKLKDEIKHRIDHDKERTFNFKDAAAAKQEDLQASQERLHTDRERMQELDRTLPTETANTQRDIKTRNQITGLGALTSRDATPIGGGHTGAEIEQLSRDRKQQYNHNIDPQHFAGLTASQQKADSAIVEYVRSKGVSDAALAATLGKLSGSLVSLPDKLKALDGIIDQINKRLNSMGGGAGGA